MKNKVWLVTGASQGFGLSIVKELLARKYKVVATSRNPEKLSNHFKKNKNLLSLKMDLTNKEEIESVVKKTVDTFGSIDVLVNNAGYGQLWTFEESSEADIRECIEINLFGTMNVTRAVLPIMRKQKYGHIYNTSSAWGYSTDPYISTYAAAKFAVDGWSESLAQELRPLGITVSSVKPGGFRTNFLSQNSMVKGQHQIDDYKESRDSWIQQLESLNGKLDGSPDRYAKFLINLTEEYDQLPIHIFAGRDCYQRAEAKIAAIKKDLDLLRDEATNLHVR